jgi:hypothetical protein
MNILMGDNHYIGIPDYGQQKTTLIVYGLKTIYPRELEHARLIKAYKPLEVGILTKRTI